MTIISPTKKLSQKEQARFNRIAIERDIAVEIVKHQGVSVTDAWLVAEAICDEYQRRVDKVAQEIEGF